MLITPRRYSFSLAFSASAIAWLNSPLVKPGSHKPVLFLSFLANSCLHNATSHRLVSTCQPCTNSKLNSSKVASSMISRHKINSCKIVMSKVSGFEVDGCEVNTLNRFYVYHDSSSKMTKGVDIVKMIHQSLDRCGKPLRSPRPL